MIHSISKQTGDTRWLTTFHQLSKTQWHITMPLKATSLLTLRKLGAPRLIVLAKLKVL
jgi:hypothetical protein